VTTRHGLSRAALAALMLVACAGTASAARARFHYGSADGCGVLSLKPDGPCNAPGEYISLFGTPRNASAAPRPNVYLTFQHPCTGRRVTVPVSLPEGTPVIQYRYRRVIYNYGSYSVEVAFLPDGSVDVIYNSGPLRAL
jgi:hypothetical protein